MNETMKSNMETAQKFFELCNIMSNDRSLADAFKDCLDKQHRTVIQSAMGVFSNVINHYAEFHRADPRNEDSLKWAREVSKIDNHFRYI